MAIDKVVVMEAEDTEEIKDLIKEEEEEEEDDKIFKEEIDMKEGASPLEWAEDMAVVDKIIIIIIWITIIIDFRRIEEEVLRENIQELRDIDLVID